MSFDRMSTDQAGAGTGSAPLHIDCGECAMRNLACDDCVVSVLLGSPNQGLDDEEQRAIAVLADSGLVPPLRLVRGGRDDQDPDVHSSGRYRQRPPAAAG